jgi:hypothetical protein
MQDLSKLAFFASLVLLTAAGQHAPSAPGALACAAGSFTPLDDSYAKTVVSSPDKEKSVRLHQGGSFEVYDGQKLIGKLGYDAEASVGVGWSPDSRQFFITYSDAGSAGGFHAHLFRILDGRGLTENKLPQIALNDFKSRHYCATRGDNQYFVGWTLDSREAFVVAEVYPASDCGNEMGYSEGYLMDVESRKVVHRYSGEEATAIGKSCRASGTVEKQKP